MASRNTHIEVPGYQGRAALVGQGAGIRITDLEGCQIGDFFLIAADDAMEIFSAAITRLVNFTPFPKLGQAFYSNRRRPMARFLADTSPGAHDMTFAPCDPEFYRELGVVEEHPSCRNNFERAMAAAGLPIAVYPDPINLFQNTPIDADGDYAIGQCVSRPGDYVEFRAEMDLVLVLTACSVDVEIAGVKPIGERSTPLRIDISA